MQDLSPEKNNLKNADLVKKPQKCETKREYQVNIYNNLDKCFCLLSPENDSYVPFV